MAQANLVTGSSDTCYYAYDSFGNLSRKMYLNNVTCYYSYDNAERVTGMDYRKSDNTQVGLFTFSRATRGAGFTQEFDNSYGVYYTYDRRRPALLSETYYIKRERREVYAFNYGYDAAGNRMKMSQRMFGSLVASSYFAYGNDNSMTQRAVITPAPSTVSSYFYYDANGAQIKQWDAESGDTTYFTYAPNGMISSITPPSGSADAWTCDYDARLNRYMQKNGTADATYFVWEGLKPLEQRKVSDDSVTARNLHGISPVPDIGTLVEIQNDLNGTPVSYAPLMDHRGSVYALLNASGNSVALRIYNAFGVILYQPGNWGTAGNPILAGYQTNWQTVNIGGKNYGITPAGRVCDFETGRFLSRDLSQLVIKTVAGSSSALGLYAATKLARATLGIVRKANDLTGCLMFLNAYLYNASPFTCDPTGFDAKTLDVGDKVSITITATLEQPSKDKDKGANLSLIYSISPCDCTSIEVVQFFHLSRRDPGEKLNQASDRGWQRDNHAGAGQKGGLKERGGYWYPFVYKNETDLKAGKPADAGNAGGTPWGEDNPGYGNYKDEEDALADYAKTGKPKIHRFEAVTILCCQAPKKKFLGAFKWGYEIDFSKAVAGSLPQISQPVDLAAKKMSGDDTLPKGSALFGEDPNDPTIKPRSTIKLSELCDPTAWDALK